VDIVLGPDVYVNASVAVGSSPDKVVQRVLGEKKGQSKTTPWVLDRVAAMLTALTAKGVFRPEAVEQQIGLIKQLVVVVEENGKHGTDDWAPGLAAAAKAAGAKRVVTDHPDLLAKEKFDGIDFISSDAWLLEHAMPPPPPPPKKK
jgi:hypothetical protein